MNTKVKVGIAAAIVAALVALIVLDQKTTPKEDQASHPGPGGDKAIVEMTGGADAPATRLREEEINNLLKKAETEFREKPTPKASGSRIKGSEDPSEKTIRTLTGEEYVIKEGDTFETIAEKKYGSKSYSSLIAEANPTIKPTTLRIGKKITLPSKSEKSEKAEKKETAVAEKAPEAPKPEVAPDPVTPKPKAVEVPVTVVDGQKIYTVQPGDTLSGISVKVYNTSRHYEKIYEANKDKIEDPNTLMVGTKLVMPPLPSKAAANSGASGAGVVATTAPAPSPAPAGAKTVQVSEGASLWKIAEKFAQEKKIGIPEMMKLIVAANPDKLKDEGSLLRLGWQLIIPE